MPNTQTLEISALFSGSSNDYFRVCKQIVDVLNEESGFVAVGYPVMAEQHQRADRLTKFFNLADDVKLSMATTQHQPANRNQYRGYYPAPEIRGFLDKERLDIGPEPGLLAPNLEGSEILSESNPWPSTEPQAGWRSDSLQYFDDLREIAVALLDSIACGLNLERRDTDNLCRGRNGTLRLLNYLPQPQHLHSNNAPEIVDQNNRWIVGIEHVDTTTLTLLWQTYPGLQIKGRDDVWRDVIPPKGGLSVHCGDLFTKLTSGVINGSIHRVLGDGTHRTSVGMFLEPDWATVIRPPNVDEGLSYAEHLLGVFSTRKKVQARRY
tara:strand:+ start:623 stop:1588 length:966 start_codon:yes stop_codon:yes gene_type:complete